MDCDILILGNGCAAQSAIAAVRRQDPNRKITVVSDILWPSYNPMLTTYYLSGKAELEPLLRQQMPEGRSACDGITRYAGSPVQRLDAVNQQVQLADGTCLQYRDCLVATGAAPLIPKMEGAELDHVFTMRTLDDVVSLKGFLSRKRVRYCPRIRSTGGASGPKTRRPKIRRSSSPKRAAASQSSALPR